MGILYNGRLPIREIPITEFPYYLPVMVFAGIFIVSFTYIMWGGIIDLLNKIDIFFLGAKMKRSVFERFCLMYGLMLITTGVILITICCLWKL